ncbi:MAG TPA: hypothetical protein VMU54_22470 [Planctomycetota bacterium]|nr:hypothetical protein [Planctomycetota bacterium]
MRAAGAVLLLLAGCSGPPLKELPVLEPPPPATRPEQAVGLSPLPSPPPSAPPPAAPAPPAAPRLEGAWRSQEMEGPGSAAYRRIHFIFGEDGAYVGVAASPKNTVVISGSFTRRDGELVLDGKDGRKRVWSCTVDEHRLVLKDGDCSLVLERIR